MCLGVCLQVNVRVSVCVCVGGLVLHVGACVPIASGWDWLDLSGSGSGSSSSDSLVKEMRLQVLQHAEGAEALYFHDLH